MAETEPSPNALGVTVARVLGAHDRPVGSAFLAAPDRLLTAAHVVNLALGQAAGAAERPTGTVVLDFPLLAPGRRLHAEVEHWVPPGTAQPGDIAGLRLVEAPPLAVSPAPIVEPDASFDLMGTVLGFPARADNGVWSIVRLRGRQGSGWTQIDLDQVSQFSIEPGFSGAPVWDPMRGTTIGMVTHAWSGTRVQSAYMVPAESLLEAWPELRELARPPSPFPGLRAFAERDADVFFGRSALVDHIVSISATASIITVVGGSGVGKSSLLAAGVVPKLRNRADVLAITCVPNEAQTPLRALALAMSRAADPEADAASRLDTADDFAEQIEQGRVADVATSVLDTRGRRDLVLIVDQFEQTLTFDEDQVAAFGRALSDLCSPTARRCLILGVRDDFLPSMGRSPELGALTARAYQVPVPELDAAELREVIEGPLDQLQAVRFDPHLIDRLIADVEHQPGRMPLLQFALAELWDRQCDGTVNYETYRQLGDIRLMLSKYADRVWWGLAPAEREAARRLLSQLVHPVPSNERAFTRRIVTSHDVSAELWRIAGRLAGDRLVVISEVEHIPGRIETAVELAHDALLVHWPTLVQIAQEDRDFRLWQDGLRRHADHWATKADTEYHRYLRQLVRLRTRLRLGRRRAQARLLSIGELREAHRWRGRHADLSSIEQEYLKASRTRQAVVWTRVTALVALASLIPTYLLADAYQERRAIEARQLSDQLAAQSMEVADTDGVRARLLAAAAWESSPTDRAWLAMTNAMASQTTGLKTAGHNGPVVEVEFSPDGTKLASLAGDGSIAVWDTSTWEPRPLEDGFERRGIADVAFSPNGSLFAVLDGNGEVRMWSTGDGSRVATWQVEYAYGLSEVDDDGGEVSFGPEGAKLAAGAEVVHVWDTTDFDEIARFDLHRVVQSVDNEQVDVRVGAMQFASNGQTLVTADHFGLVREWDVVTGSEVWTGNLYGKDNTKPVSFLRQNPADPYEFASCSYPCQVVNARTGEQQVFNDFGGLVPTYSSDGTHLAASGWYGGWVWDPTDPTRAIGTIPSGLGILDIAINGDTGTIAGATDEGVQLLALKPPTSDTSTEPSGNTSDGPPRIFIADDLGSQLWELENEWTPTRYETGLVGEFPVSSADGSTIAAEHSGPDGAQSIQVINLGTRDPITEITGEPGESLSSMALSPDGSLLALSRSRPSDSSDPSSEWQDSVELWNTETGTLLHTLASERSSYLVGTAVFSRDGTTLATLLSENAQVWDIGTGTLRKEFSDIRSGAVSVALSPDGSLLAVGNNRTGFELRDLDTGRSEEIQLEGNPQSGEFAAMGMEFTRDGEHLLLTSPEYGLLAWNLELEAVAAEFTGELGGWFASSSDGKYLAVAGPSFFTIDIGFLRDPYRAICDQVDRLTMEERRSYLSGADVDPTRVCASPN